MAENRFEFRYAARDVSSAQRMRFLRSNQLKVMVGVWVASTLFLMVPLLIPGLFPNSPFSSWALVLEIALAYGATMAVLALLTPGMDYYFRRFWRMPLLLRFNERQLRLSVVGGKSKGLVLAWGQILNVQENGRVWVLYYGEGGKFIILPKSIFPKDEHGARGEQRFRDLLARRAAIPAAAVGEEEAEEAQPAEKPGKS